MHKLTRLLSTIAIVSALYGCAIEEAELDQEYETGEPTVAVWDYQGTDTLTSPELVMATPSMYDDTQIAEWRDPDNAICACDNAACEEAYVLDNYGCGACVLVTCGDRFAGGCYPCSDPNGIVQADTYPTSAAQR